MVPAPILRNLHAEPWWRSLSHGVSPSQQVPSLRSFLTRDALRVAWDALGPESSPGVDGMHGRYFEHHLHANLERIAAWVVSPSWCPDPLRVVHVPKGSGRFRRLGIPTLRDRLVQRAMVDAATPLVEALLHPHVHGFRPGRSTRSAVSCLRRQLRGHPPGDLAKGDIFELFDQLDHRLVRRVARSCWDDSDWLRLVDGFLYCWVGPKGPGYGVPQGAPLSPLLANLALAEALDGPLEFCMAGSVGRLDGMRPGGLVAWVRYADDILLASPGPGQGRELLAWVDATSRQSGLWLSGAKAEVLDADATGSLAWLGGFLTQTEAGPHWTRQPSHRTSGALRRRVRAG
jgi:RNA-directed DNA polymerase